jgi:hypothetical protein
MQHIHWTSNAENYRPNPFGYKALPLKTLVQTDWPVIFSDPEVDAARE